MAVLRRRPEVRAAGDGARGLGHDRLRHHPDPGRTPGLQRLRVVRRRRGRRRRGDRRGALDAGSHRPVVGPGVWRLGLVSGPGVWRLVSGTWCLGLVSGACPTRLYPLRHRSVPSVIEECRSGSSKRHSSMTLGTL